MPTHGKDAAATGANIRSRDARATEQGNRGQGCPRHREREDYDAQQMPPVWVSQYDVRQEYDKNGNRTRFHRNTARIPVGAGL